MGKHDVNGTVNTIYVKDNPASLLEVHSDGNKQVDKLDIMYLDFQKGFDSFSAKAMKILSDHGLDKRSFSDLKVERKG